MEHYDAKGFKPFNKNCDSKLFLATYNITSKNGILITHVAYGDGYGHSQAGYYDVHGYKIIAFADFAAEVGIKVPVFVMTSEDGVPLYKGDTAHHVRRKFYANGVEYNGTFTITGNGVSGYVFSSYEAAEMWIREQNRPKEIRIEGDGGYAIVRKDRLDIQTTGKYGTPTGLFIEGEDLKRAFEAYQSLQEGKS